MICQQCNNAIMCHSFPEPLLLSYRGFSKQVATQVFLECSNGCNQSTESLNGIVDMDAELALFKKEINMKLSVGEGL